MRRPNARLRKRCAEDRGASALEFALIVPILLVLVCGIIEFGFMFQAQMALSYAAREGARLASVNRYSQAQVVDRAYPLTTARGLSVTESNADSGDSVTVVAIYPYTPQVLPWLPAVTLRGQATMRKEY
jgi:hypothetical protein